MNNNPSQNNLTNNNHGLNFNCSTDGLNNYSNTLPPIASQNTHNLNAFYGHNNDSSNNHIFPVHPPTDNNVYNRTQPMPQNPSTSQYSQYIDQIPLQNAFSPINSLNITINSPQTYFIFMPMSSSDMQNQFQQGNNHSQSQPQFQQQQFNK